VNYGPQSNSFTLVLPFTILLVYLHYCILTRVESANVLDEGLRIGEIGRRMNSKVRLVEIGVCRK
jgi:hypothetical protein